MTAMGIIAACEWAANRCRQLLSQLRGVAQVVERYFREVEAASSSLVTPTAQNQITFMEMAVCFLPKIKTAISYFSYKEL